MSWGVMPPAYIQLVASYVYSETTSPPPVISTALRIIKDRATPSSFRQMHHCVLIYLNALSYSCIYKSNFYGDNK